MTTETQYCEPWLAEVIENMSDKRKFELRNVSKEFGSRTVLNNTNLSLTEGEHVILMGTSGKGKTTILNLIAGLTEPTSGEVFLNDMDISAVKDLRSDIISYMPCGDTLIESLTVYENLLLVHHSLFFDKKRKMSECIARINKVLEMLKITDIAKSYPCELSSGEYKRVCFARAITQRTPFMLFDEPTSNLDDVSANIIINAFNSDMFDDVGYIIATHDQRLIGKDRRVITL